ncbi:isopentenyl-diphosphate Delta-isomerase [Microterricola pindariensis]|uniref:Isopentenyl-diphosphate Delta-isomerase n=1 Tax=Microterricola pindariensis TaxID=478010 RepID=A0ABX5AYA3_9MICO|nr:isopentenyl-diphosphate Delta-isomerase [Microterricola pindariensis]PPL19631.1 isopentenyl-diphosphate delta-isomerase [Microterricola pindariensis]
MSGLNASPVPDTSGEYVVLLDENGQPSGTAAKEALHTAETPLHLAFSCHIANSAGELLVTRRALGKRSWPGVWTNSFCGHPAPGESIEAALVRHGQSELGLQLDPVRHRLTLELPDFRYRAVDPAGIVENEICPVYTAVTDEVPTPNPDEVMELAWVAPESLARSISSTPWAFSPWLVLQTAALEGRMRP